MHEKISILSHHVFFYFYNIQQRTFHLFYDRPPHSADFIFIPHPTADLYVEVIHDNIDTNLECISPPTTACVKLPFIQWIMWCADIHKVLTLI